MLFTVNLFYGIGFSVSKMVMPAFIRPFGFIVIRVAVCSLLFLLLQKIWINERMQRKDLPRLMLCGLFGVAINQLLFFKGLSMTLPINASLMMILTPLLVLFFAVAGGQERFTSVKISGVLLGASGAFILLAGKGFHFSSDTLTGDLLILLNATSYAIYLVIVRPLMKTYHPLSVITWVFMLGFIPVVFTGWEEFMQIDFASFTPGIWAAVLFVVMGTTFVAYLFNILALREVNSSVVGAYIYLQPLIAAAVATLLGVDQLTPQKALAGLFIFTGVYLVTFGLPTKYNNA